MTIFARLQQASYCKNGLAENGKLIHGDDTNLLNMFEAALRQSDNLNIHTRNSLRASTPVLNCNDAKLVNINDFKRQKTLMTKSEFS